jgi:hypothetical protein
MDLVLLLASGICQFALAAMGVYVTVRPISDKTKEYWFMGAFGAIGLLSIGLLGLVGARSEATQQDIRDTLQILLHGGGNILPSQIRIITTEQYGATDADKYIIVRKLSKEPVRIDLPRNPKLGDEIEVKLAKATGDPKCIGAAVILGNGNKIDGNDDIEMNGCGEEIGVIFDGQEWDIH